MTDIKGISPSYCTHKILMEDNFKLVIQPQRRLNPKVQDVVKKEIVKLLDSWLIYLISDSSWVSPIHVVPKKGGMTVVLNDDNELIPSCTVTGWRVMQRSSYLSKMYDGNFPRHGRRLYGSIHGRLLGTFTEEEIADEFPDEHLMALKTKINNDEPCASVTGRKVYESKFFWPSIFKDAKDYVMRCDACQRSGNISSRSEMPQNSIQVEAQALPTNDAHVVIKFLRRLFARFGVPKALITTAKNRFMELNELMELRDNAYENTRIYKERTKKWHDSRLRGDKDFKVGDLVLLFKSRFKMHPGKLKSRWYGPNVVKTVYPYGTVEITDKNGVSFKVNRQRLKKYHERHIDTEDKEVVEFEEYATRPRERNIDEYWWRIYKSGDLEVLES
ncbi:reverse transcriptase domain-containing protein [Tanacetum coccineum]